MGSIYKSTSHFYFYGMIKMDLKKHNFLKKEESILSAKVFPRGVFEGLTISIVNGMSDNTWTITTSNTANISYYDGTNTTTIAGNVRYNSTTNGNGNLEYFDGVTWRTLNLSAQVV